jgi:hypothetical protein
LYSEETGQPTALWTVTWEKIDTFLPHLKQVGVGKPIRILIQYFASMRIRIQAFANTQKFNFYASYFFEIPRFPCSKDKYVIFIDAGNS